MNNPELIIFDMDGTLYDIGDLIEFNFKQESEFLSIRKNISLKEAEQLLKDNYIFPYVSKDAKSCTEFFLNIGLDITEWNKVRSKDFPLEYIKKENCVKEEVIKKYKKYCPVVLVSNNTLDNIKDILNYMNINKDVFDLIIGKDSSLTYSKDKTNSFIEAANYFEASYTRIISIGDRYNTDLLPIINLGGKGLRVDGPMGVKEGLKIFEEINEGIHYKLY